jgi:hypothetical protein
MNMNDAVIAKITVKKILSQVDQIETLLAFGGTDIGVKMTLSDWLTEMRVHLRKLECAVEHAAA